MNPQKNTNCTVCGKTYTQVQGLYRHQRENHQMDTRKLFQCYHCSLKFQTKSLLVVHLKEHINPYSKSRKVNKRIRCAVSSCDEILSNTKAYHGHLVKDHSYTLEEKKLHFENREIFYEWKIQMEEEQKVTFVQDTSAKIVGNIKRLYFHCHRSFFPRQKHTLKRHPKNIGSNKLGRACPAIIIASIGEVVEVDFFPTHVGHEREIGRTHLSKNDRNSIAGKLLEGVTIQRVLDDVRQQAAATGFMDRRIHLLEKKDLHNIKRDFGISYSTKLHENDAISIKLWVEEMRRKDAENCEVLYYKEQGQSSDQSEVSLEDDDFLLIIMTQFQQSMLCKYGQEKICIDGTHGLNAYNFQLYTIMVVDGFGHGVPVAFCFSNRCDTKLFQLYFNCIKDRVGIVHTRVFMSDDAPAFYNAWCSMMGSATHQLLCTWHVSRNWFQNLYKITGLNCADKKKLVFKTLKVLQKQVDEETFSRGLHKFLNDLSNDSDTACFGEYFLKTYCNRTEKWAYYGRKYLGINTNMYLEALHKKIKHIYLEGKQCKRLDKSLNSLLLLIRDSAFEQFINLSKNKLTTKNLKVRESHEKSISISDSMINVLTEHRSWQITSSKSLSVTYVVEKMEDDTGCSQNCNLKCLVCKICIHDFKCTCLDSIINLNICKHIHSVIRLQNVAQQNADSTENKFAEINNFSLSTTNLNQIPLTGSNDPLKDKCDQLKSKCEMLLGLCSRSSISNNSFNKINKLLDTAISEANKGHVNFSHKASEINVKKKIEPQTRFYNKQKRKRDCIHPNPSEMDENVIRESFLQPHTSDVLNIHGNFDHSYI